MNFAIWCTALLGLLVFALGFAVSATRGATGVNYGSSGDPADRLHKLVRAHANAAEYAPLLALLILLIAMQGASAWMLWTAGAAVAFRYLHAAGMVLCPTLAAPYPPRFIGALGTYLTGLALVVAVLVA